MNDQLIANATLVGDRLFLVKLFRLPKWLLIVMGLLLGDIFLNPSSHLYAQPNGKGEQAAPRILKVGVGGTPPFVIHAKNKQEEVTGISIDIWENIALAESWQFEYIPITNIKEGLEAISEEKLDILIGNISITPERMKQINITFTQPYYNGSIGVMVPSKPPNFYHRIAPFFGIAALSSVGILILLLFIVGNLIWLVEHRQNPTEFNPDYREGIQNGLWFAIVTLSTVGYGDRTPKTKMGQLITAIWMIVALLTFSSITAGLASALTTALSEKSRMPRVTQLSDLQGLSIATVSQSTSEKWAKFYHTKIILTPNLQTAIDLLKTGRVEAVIFDREVLLYHVKKHPEDRLQVTSLELNIEPYGFVLPSTSPLQKILNVHLLAIAYSHEMNEISEKWLGISKNFSLSTK